MLLGLVVFGFLSLIVGGWLLKTKDMYISRVAGFILVALGIVLIALGTIIPFSM